MRVALDTNILVYAEGLNGNGMRNSAHSLLASLPAEAVLLPVQVLGELFNVLVKKGSRSRKSARAAILEWKDSFQLIETTNLAMISAIDLAAEHQLFIWDALVISISSQAGCRLLLSQDLHNGFTWGGTTVVDPFVVPRHPLLEALLSAPLD